MKKVISVASFPKRVLIGLLDLIFTLIFMFLLKYIIPGKLPVISFVLIFVVTSFFYRFKGSSLGMLICRASLRKSNSFRYQGLDMIIRRQLVAILTIPLAPINFLWILFTKRNQSWNDIISKSIVYTTTSDNTIEPNLPESTENRPLKISAYILTVITAVTFIMSIALFGFYDVIYTPEQLEIEKEYIVNYKVDGSSGYYQLVGFGAPKDISPFEYSQGLLIDRETLYNDSTYTDPMGMMEENSDNLLFREAVDRLVVLLADSLANQPHILLSKKAEIDSLFNYYNYFEERYQNILNFSTFNKKHIHILGQSGEFLDVIAYSRLREIKAKLLFVEGQHLESMELLTKGLLVSRHISTNSVTAYMRVIAEISSRNILTALSEIIDFEEDVPEIVVDTINNISSLKPSEISIESFLNYSIQSHILYFETLFGESFDKPIYKEDGTLSNKEFGFSPRKRLVEIISYHNQWTKISQLPADELYTYYNSGVRPELEVSIIDYIAFPFNSVMSSNFQYLNIDKFILRSHLLDLAIQQLKAKVDIVVNKVPSEEIDDFLNQNNDKYHDTFTSKSLQWNAETNELESGIKLPFGISTLKINFDKVTDENIEN